MKSKEVTLEEAVDRSLDEMPADFLIKSYLLKNRAEVMNMCLTEYNEAETMQRFKEEGREEGRKEGREQIIREMLRKGKTVEEIVDFCGVTYELVKDIEDKLT